MISLTLFAMLAFCVITPTLTAASSAAFVTSTPSLARTGQRCDPTRHASVQLRANPEHIKELSRDIDIKLGGKAYLLDVRELDEWTAGHLSVARPAPLSGLMAGKWMDSKTGVFHEGTFPIDPKTGVAIVLNRKIYVHCAMGMRASKAAELFEKMGYSNVVPLAEGFQELVAMEISDVVTGGTNALID